MAGRRAAEDVLPDTTAGARGTGTSGPAERRGTVGVYDRPSWWRTKQGAITIAAVAASSVLTLFFYLAAG